MAKYELELKPNDLYNLSDKLKKFADNLPKLQSEILHTLADYTKSQIKYYINQSVNEEYSTGWLEQNVFNTEIFNDTIKVFVDTNAVPYALYVEYGTGIVGSNNPHPEGNGNYKTEGWWYPTTANDPNPRKKQLENGDWIVYTEGQKAHKFMYNAFQDLRQNYKKIIIDLLMEEGYI